MRRCIFEEQNYDLSRVLLDPAEFKLFCDREGGFSLRKEYKEQAIKAGEDLLEKHYPVLTVSLYRSFVQKGERAAYESPCHERRRDLLTLALAEAYEDQGRFTDRILDLVWMILEESCWVVPAHLNPIPGDKTHSLPYSYENRRNYIDLFAGATGADLAWVYFLCREKFDEISPVINKRILENLRDRIILPFIEGKDALLWMGVPGGWMNNWCPWIISNVLTVCALTERSKEIWHKTVASALEGLDRFTATYEEDGACEEGPVYWGAACGALYNACLVLYDMSGGRINAFADPLIRKMGEFLPAVYVCGNYYLNYSDASPKVTPAPWGADWARLCGSALMKSFWGAMSHQGDLLPRIDRSMPYRYFRLLGMEPLPASDLTVSQRGFFPSLDLSVLREGIESDKGLYLSLKGCHNAVSHNHLDVGNFVLFADGDPIFIDAGVGRYTARTFDGRRYTIWSMRSEYHNLPTVNGIDQSPGRNYCASDVEYNEETGALSMQLKTAYPEEAAIASFVRSAGIENGQAVIADKIILEKDGSICFHLLCNCSPQLVEPGLFTVHGHPVHYDPRLTLTVDFPDLTRPETETLPRNWDCDSFTRINLSASLRSGECGCFRLAVEA